MNARICSDCAHCRPHITVTGNEFGPIVHRDYGRARCALTDVVTHHGGAGEYCIDERGAAGGCGPDAANFLPKPPPPPPKPGFLQRLFGRT